MQRSLTWSLLTQFLAYLCASGEFFVLVESLEQSHLRKCCATQFFSCEKIRIMGGSSVSLKEHVHQ